ncbi:MAG: hypothetical protein J6W82_04645, partial [Bacteroidales bacterium]|nr:hypothetical protein [Bacteroidales bacterium]
MKQHIISALALFVALSAVSCNREIEVVPAPVSDAGIIITADCSDPDTRTQRDGDGKMYWTPGDEIAVVVMNKSSEKLTPIVKFVSTNDAP